MSGSVERSVTFYSAGAPLQGTLALPDGAGPFPVVLISQAINGRRWEADSAIAERLAQNGIAAFTHEWRGFEGEESDGELIPAEVVADIRAAISYLCAQPEVRADSVALLGRSFGSGFSILTAAEDLRVACVVCLTPFGDFDRRTLLVRGLDDWEELHRQIDHHAEVAAITGERVDISVAEVLHARDPHGVAEPEARVGPGTKPPPSISLRSARHVLAMRPEEHLAAIAGRPILFVHPSQDRMFPLSEAYSLYAKARDPKRLAFIEAQSHFDFYAGVDDEAWARMFAEVLGWLRSHIVSDEGSGT